ncbi:hypothetical protein Plhal304r1_c031g0100121 [Plasmopara halstedii]
MTISSLSRSKYHLAFRTWIALHHSIRIDDEHCMSFVIRNVQCIFIIRRRSPYQTCKLRRVIALVHVDVDREDLLKPIEVEEINTLKLSEHRDTVLNPLSLTIYLKCVLNSCLNSPCIFVRIRSL